MEESGWSDSVVIAGVLHDVVEDTRVSVEEILSEFGVAVAKIVEAVSRRANEPRRDYCARIVAAGAIAVVVKLADIADNADESRLGRLVPDVAAGLREKHRKMRSWLTGEVT